MEKRLLQICIVVGSLVPIVGGGWGALHALGAGSFEAGNHHRYLSGLLLAIGLAFWSTVPRIETMTARVQLLTGLVVVGGLCRLLGVALGDPATPMVLGALAMELVVTPLLCLWQARVAKSALS